MNNDPAKRSLRTGGEEGEEETEGIPLGAIRTHLVWREELVVVFIHVHVVTVKLRRDTERRRDEKAVRQRLTRYHRDRKQRLSVSQQRYRNSVTRQPNDCKCSAYRP